MKRELRKPERKSTMNTKATLSSIFKRKTTNNECTINQTNCVTQCSCPIHSICPSII